MNALTLRISNGGIRKTKTVGGYAALDIAKFMPESLVADNTFHEFFQAETAEKQLSELKRILAKNIGNIHSNATMRFLVKVFFHSDAKHPVKCSVNRHITKSFVAAEGTETFTDILCQEILESVGQSHRSYQDYIVVVSKLATCVENFPAGFTAVKILEVALLVYFSSCLQFSVVILQTNNCLSPTEKNEIFNLCHLTLRLFLHIIQKINPEHVEDTKKLFVSIKKGIKYLFYDGDVPMDTKSVCGMLFLTVYMMDHGGNSWTDFFEESKDAEIQSMLQDDTVRLSLYSAAASLVNMDKLLAHYVGDSSALLVLVAKLEEISRKRSSDPLIVLGVTRTLVQISKQLRPPAPEAPVEILTTFTWEHLDHHLDSVRHLSAQILGNVFKLVAGSQTGNSAMGKLISLLKDPQYKYTKRYFILLTVLCKERRPLQFLSEINIGLNDLFLPLQTQAVQACAASALETIIDRHMDRSVTTQEVYDQWFCPILSHVDSCGDLDSSVINILENLMVKPLKKDEGIIEFICERLRSEDSQKLKLMLLSVAHKAGVLHKLTKSHIEIEAPLPIEDCDASSGDAGVSKGVVGIAGVSSTHGSKVVDGENLWKGVVTYEFFERAAVCSKENVRIIALSLIVESPKTTEAFCQGELNFIITFLKYNINEQSPNFRQLTLSMMKKFIARLEDSYRVMKREGTPCDFYLPFLSQLSRLCLDSLFPGANYGRRCVALQLLAWSLEISLEGYHREWRTADVGRLLTVLEDSYESNKALALTVLEACPANLLTCKEYSVSLELDDILRQAAALAPAESAAAAYKLQLLCTKLPDLILDGAAPPVPQPVTFALVRILLDRLSKEVSQCERGAAHAPTAPMYGALYCIRRAITDRSPLYVSSNSAWSALIGEVIDSCKRATAAVAGVVCSSSPEGHLPMDGSDVTLYDHGNSRGLVVDGRPVTAQMVLLCSWRTFKEASLLLGELCSRMSIGPGCTLSEAQVAEIGDYFTQLLCETKHRGALEQAYAGFTLLLTTLWRDPQSGLHGLPRRWLAEVFRAVEAPGALSATRRGAGAPFLVQALVTTEVQVQAQMRSFHESMTRLLRLARAPSTLVGEKETAIQDTMDGDESETQGASADHELSAETRTHAMNILRALFRNSALDRHVAAYVGEGLRVALDGAKLPTWMERNASTLLLSALVVRAFGVTRSKDTERLCVRNRMTGRIFFHKYPQLYDCMLRELAGRGAAGGGGLYPTLLVLARLYPSALEGTVCSFKVSEFETPLRGCARACVLQTRRLAARALAAIAPPDKRQQYILSMLEAVGDQNIERNYCHGTLLQASRLLEDMDPEPGAAGAVGTLAVQAAWLLRQPCYLLAHEYIKLFNLLLFKFPSLSKECDIMDLVTCDLAAILSREDIEPVSFGRELCLADALHLYLILHRRHQRSCVKEGHKKTPFGLSNKQPDFVEALMKKCFEHPCYEIALSALDFLLIISNKLNPESNLQICLKEVFEEGYLRGCNVVYLAEGVGVLLRKTRYLECVQKSLEVLTMLGNYCDDVNIQAHVAAGVVAHTPSEGGQSIRLPLETPSHEDVATVLLQCLQTADENLAPLLLENLFAVTKSFQRKTPDSGAEYRMNRGAAAAARALASGARDEGCRRAAATCLAATVRAPSRSHNTSAVEYKTDLYAALVLLLEDECDDIRQMAVRASCCLAALHGVIDDRSYQHGVVPSFALELLLDAAAAEKDGGSILLALGLLDFHGEVCVSDEIADEGRVFEGERYNTHAEEARVARAAASRLRSICPTPLHTQSLSNTQSPPHDSQSPPHDTQSPLHDSRSPLHDIQSPLHDSRSQLDDTQSPLHDLQSPLHDTQSPTNDSQSPLHNTGKLTPLNIPNKEYWESLCGDNLDLFLKIVYDETFIPGPADHPKVKIFVETFTSNSSRVDTHLRQYMMSLLLITKHC